MSFILAPILVINSLILFFLLLSILLNISRYRLTRPANTKTSIDDLPSVSVCIPARNETHALVDCLTSVVATNYPKLEIIVLDDCSQDRTSHIIRSFSHEGVRFVQGETPSDGWLGKNNAYDILSREARGDVLIFMSVDTRVGINSFSQLAQYVQHHKISMLSVLAERRDGYLASIIASPLRYFWQLHLPRSLNTPLASSLWAIRSDALEKIGGFSIVKNDILPENSLANIFSKQHMYRFIASDKELEITYAKKWASQTATAIRIWFPLLKDSVMLSLLASVGHILLFTLPLLVLLYSVYYPISDVMIWLIAISLTLEIAIAVIYNSIVSGRKYIGLVSFFTLPILGFQEAVLIIISAIQYKRGVVNWKGRNVCYPTIMKNINN